MIIWSSIIQFKNRAVFWACNEHFSCLHDFGSFSHFRMEYNCINLSCTCEMNIYPLLLNAFKIMFKDLKVTHNTKMFKLI